MVVGQRPACRLGVGLPDAHVRSLGHHPAHPLLRQVGNLTGGTNLLSRGAEAGWTFPFHALA